MTDTPNDLRFNACLVAILASWLAIAATAACKALS
jgi:hypothetical protein